ncbi:MAG: endonuclease MutS2 [Chloroflexota bacterium]|nr:endonuclease MutS2 [Chloroflexota bacterium]
MHEKSIQTLEFPKILAKVAQEAAFSASKDLVMELEPTPDLEQARRRLAYTTEASHLIDQHPDAGVRSAHDIRPLLIRAARDGVLTPTDLADVLETTRSTLYVARLLDKLDAETFPLLSMLGRDIPQRPHIVRRIEETVSEDGEVLDTASPALRKTRFDIRGANQRLQDRLRTLVGEFGNSLQEPIITIRNDRYVVPVKSESRSHVRGIIHDQSSSGATVFIEPMVVVELNNRVRELQIAERQEVERILRVLSAEVGHEAEALKVAVELLAEFDLHLAKARYGRMTRANEPKLNDQGRVDLRNARHPLLTGNVVPINFHLGRDFFMVVITGPNTGGKTVALKTVGLLTLMAQAGLHIPVDAGSEVAVFEDVLADIGDEQSIEQSLSTFSSHLTRIIEILRRIEEEQKRGTPDIHGTMAETLINKQAKGPRVLVLFDELGAGTDPSEGSALARAILTFLLARHVTTVATTHYSELKAFAHEQEGVANASVEFNIETLSPTYKLSIGLPGRSNALAIANRLGLEQDIIEHAREFLGSAGVRMENLLEGLQTEQKAVEDEHFHLSMERAEAEYQRRQLEEERHELEEQRVRVLNEARAQARREIEDVQTQLAKVRVDVSRINMTRERLGEARQIARNLEERVSPVPEPSRPKKKEAEPEPAEGPLKIGDTVRVLSFGQNAEMVSLSADHSEAEVQMGALRFRVNVDNIERLSKRKAAMVQERPNVVVPRYEDRPEVATQLDMRGWRVDQALEELETYLNDAALSGMSSVRIVHGKGTGALRAAVRDHLAHHSLVKSYISAPPQEGGDGVTIVKLSA